MRQTISNLMWGRGIAPVPSNNNRGPFRLGQFGTQAVEVALILGTRELRQGCAWLCPRLTYAIARTHWSFSHMRISTCETVIVLQMGYKSESFVKVDTWDGGDAPSPHVG